MSKLLPILAYNFLCMMSMMSLLPVIGPIVREVGLEEWHAGLIVGVSGIFWMIFARFWGKKSDSKGRRPILIITAIGFIASFFSLSVFLNFTISSSTDLALSTSSILIVFIIFRSLMGAFFAGVPPVCSAYISDVTTKKNRTAGMALLGSSTALAMICGPLLAGMLARKSLIFPLYVASFIPVLCLIIAVFILPKVDTLTVKKNTNIRLSDSRLRVPILAAFLSSSCIYSGNICLGFYGLDVLHLEPQMAAVTSGYAMGTVGVAMLFIHMIMNKMKKVSEMQWLKFGAIFGVFGFVILIMFNTVTGLLVGYAISSLGIGAIFPSMQSIASKSVEENEQGLAAGSLSAAQGLAMVTAPIFGTMLYEINPLYPYVTIVILLSILFVYLLAQKKPVTQL